MSSFLACAAQLTATADLPANLAICHRLAADAAARGGQLLVLPECFAFIGEKLGDKVALAERLDLGQPGPILGALLEMATRHKLWVVGGGLPELPGDDEDPAPAGTTRVFNTCAVVSPDGELAACYRKIHLFDIDLPGRAVFQESASTAPGREVVTVETPLARLGLSICYDLRFPELYRALALDHGAEVLLVPAAFTAHTGAAHWHTLLRARAIENQCFVIAAAQTGAHHGTRSSYGHSLILDPWGTTLAELEAGTGLAVAEIDLAAIGRLRGEMPCHRHRVLGR